MNTQEGLRTLAGRDAPAAPYGFEEFVKRRAAAAAGRRNALLGIAGSIAVLAIVSTIALLTQAPSPPQLAEAAAEPQRAVVSAKPPALVNMDQFDVTTEMEDSIAVLDAELSVARVQAMPVEQLRQLESTRQQLNESLRRVSYAHSLLNL